MRAIRFTASLATALAVFAFATECAAYRLPPYKMSAEERSAPAEANLEHYQERLDEMSALVPLGVIENRRRDHGVKLSPKQRRAISDFDELKVAHTFWNYVVSLKRELMSLHAEGAPQSVENEADVMAKVVVQTIYDLSQEYKIAVSALVQNYLVNSGHREKGFCYHYVSDLRKALKEYGWKHFELHWGEAWPQTYRENNALVVTAAGKAFASGIAIDSWRTAGKPFWTPVKGDRFPWQEAFNVERDYVLE